MCSILVNRLLLLGSEELAPIVYLTQIYTVTHYVLHLVKELFASPSTRGLLTRLPLRLPLGL